MIDFIGLNSPQCLDLNSEPPSSSAISFSPHVSTSSIVNGPSMERSSYSHFLPQQPSFGMMYRGNVYNIHPPRFYSSEQQQLMFLNQRMMTHSPWNNPQQFPHPNMINQQQQSIGKLALPSTNESYSHPLESLERLVLLPESQVIILNLFFKNWRCGSVYPPISGVGD